MKKKNRVIPLPKGKAKSQDWDNNIHCYHDQDSQKELQSSEIDIPTFRPHFDDARFGSTSSKDEPRSDRSIAAELTQHLEMEADINTVDVEVIVKNGEVTLKGNVRDKKMKRFVEEQVARCSGVKDIYNDLHLKRR